MIRSRISWILLLILSLSLATVHGQVEKRIIFLSWKHVVDRSLKDNLSLKLKSLEYDIQNLETWKSLSYFLPSLSYQGLAQNNIELPVFVFMGQRFVVGTPYTFQHALSLSLPILTGGSRWLNHSMQNSIKKSLAEELQGKKEETVLNAMQAYYGIILSGELTRSTDEAVMVAKHNLDQVQKFYNAGTATELDYQRAKAQYSSTLPLLESAQSNYKLSFQRLKGLLDLPLTDSLVVVDSLEKMEFLNEYSTVPLEHFKELSNEHRNDMKALQYQQEAAKSGEHLALGQFTPSVTLIGSVDHSAPIDNARVAWSDYIRSKSITLSISWPLLEGGKRVLDYQIAKMKSDQMGLLVKQAQQGIELDVEQSYYNYIETSKSLQSLKETLEQYRESLRISNLLYLQGMSNQLDVLNAQLLYTKSNTEYLQGVYRYNVSQLALLRSVGLLENIWK
ncbi:MAG: TolC family protein [bacterium]